MKISIAMATYNGARYLEAQLQSLLEQTRQPDEVIITDDCSTDETEEIVHQFANSAPFKVRFHCNDKNLGYGGNFNSALMKTTGDLVFLSDQDDVWFPNKIEHMLEVSRRNPEALLLMNDAALTDSDLNETGLTKIGQIKSSGHSIDTFVMGCCCCIRRELLDFCLPIPSNFDSHDIWLAWFADGLRAKLVVPDVLQYYRRHVSNESDFIANSAKKVTRAQTFLHTLGQVVRKESAREKQAELERMRSYLDGLGEVQHRAPAKYLQKLLELEVLFQQRLEVGEKRMLLREKSFPHRIVSAGTMLKNGGYRQASGLSSFLRDILG